MPHTSTSDGPHWLAFD